MKPIKKAELLILKKSVASQPESEELPAIDTAITSEPIIEQQPPQAQESQSQATEYLPSHVPVQDYPRLQSVVNSGWQASDIWRELRVDEFCD
ncbi:hypothetical protein H6G64_34305 [Calothrix sp. FACHB-156]|nr:hypothetical protein [Calothrix sp. FACHB-156]